MTFGNYIQAQSNPNTLQPEEELQFAKFLVNHTVDAAFWLGPDARFLYVNDVACRLLGYSRKELLFELNQNQQHKSRVKHIFFA